MFYNALARKGKLDDTVEHDIESVVALHNNMNEKTWQKVLEWEATTTSGSGGGGGGTNALATPKLLKFQGRPTDLSPKAALKHYLLGHPLPYDRHDWVIERPDGSTVRYVIDYYHDESLARDDPDSARPALHAPASTNSLLVDVRPALDTPTALWHRSITMPYATWISQSTSFEPLPLFPTPTMKGQVQESVAVWRGIQAAAAAAKSQRKDDDDNDRSMLTETRARELSRAFFTIQSQCRTQQRALDQCETEQEYARASIDVTLCMAQTVCPLQHSALVQCLNQNDNEEAIAQAMSVVQDCVALQAQQHAQAKKQFPSVFS
jgi:cytochrome c heme-lyase